MTQFVVGAPPPPPPTPPSRHANHRRKRATRGRTEHDVVRRSFCARAARTRKKNTKCRMGRHRQHRTRVGRKYTHAHTHTQKREGKTSQEIRRWTNIISSTGYDCKTIKITKTGSQACRETQLLLIVELYCRTAVVKMPSRASVDLL